MLTQDLVRNLFDYRDGKLYWRAKRRGVQVGTEAGYAHRSGYRVVSIHSTKHLVHRIVFLHQRGYLPKYLDHIDNDRNNNRVENLRPVTQSQNQWNRKKQSNNTSNAKNVSWNKETSRWVVRLCRDKVWLYFGRYKSFDEAQRIAADARTKLFGDFARHT